MLKMKKRMFITIACSLLLCSVWQSPVSATEVRDKSEILQDIDEYMHRSMRANHMQAASLSIVKEDEVFYAKGYGTFEDGQKVTGGTHFPIASLSKSFTALAILQLADNGQIDLDAAYDSYFPKHSVRDLRVHNITIRQLLNQTSGLNDKVNPDMTRKPQFQTLHEVNQLLKEVQLAHSPGTAYSYHNPNYVLLANLVENVSGERFSDYLNNHIFKPLGMNHTFSVRTTQQFYGNKAVPIGHYLSLGRAVGQKEPLWFIEGPAGIVSTAEDMSRWMLAQYQGQLLSPTLMKQYHAAGTIGSYGMGWLADQEESHGRIISHSGIFWTYKSEEKIYLDEEMGIAVMFNSGLNASVNYSTFIDDIAKIMRGEQLETSFVNGRNVEMIMIAVIIATLVWGIYAYFHIRLRNKRLTTSKIILITIGRLTPILILLTLSPLMTFIGGGRVLPWFGIWTTLSTPIIWLVVWSIVNVVHLFCYYSVYVQYKKNSRLN